MTPNAKPVLPDAHPQMLRGSSEVDPQRLGMDARRSIGQCFEWALEQKRMEKQHAAYLMKYTDAGVVSRWINGTERVQLDKVKLHLGPVYQEFLLAMLQDCPGVEIKTQVTLARTA